MEALATPQNDIISDALAVRDFHQKRIIRFNEGKQLPHEDHDSLRKSVKIDRVLTDFIGDGQEVDLSWNTSAIVDMG